MTMVIQYFSKPSFLAMTKQLLSHFRNAQVLFHRVYCCFRNVYAHDVRFESLLPQASRNTICRRTEVIAVQKTAVSYKYLQFCVGRLLFRAAQWVLRTRRWDFSHTIKFKRLNVRLIRISLLFPAHTVEYSLHSLRINGIHCCVDKYGLSHDRLLGF